ncbi:MAG: DUF2207 domain-containing protein, partial [Clostridia bacterium]|nr:DUF2207 domain-containing protein [Clostridia bacterium]
TVRHDMTPYYVIIAACVLLAVLCALKFLVFNKDGLTPVVNVEAPDDMDPLKMGKLIDNRVDKSDVTSLIYYWANKGYIKINMDNQSDIELIRIYKNLPPQSPSYQKIMYEGLFKRGDSVKINSLTNSFYTTVEAVTRKVNTESGKLYDGKSMSAAVLFAVLGALLMAVTPIVMCFLNLTILTITPLFVVIPAFIVFAVTLAVRYNRLKLGKGKLALAYLGIAVLSAVCVAVYVFFVPSYIVEVLPKIILGAAGFAIVMLSTLLVSRTEKYTQKLNKIVGFRNFILYAEKNRLETMLEQNPEFYYQILPYAIVLGVSDIWENKFAALTVTPPNWVVGSRHDTLFNFMVFNAAIRTVNTRMTTAFIFRPSSGSFSGGGSHGGSFGGFSGGGHGGGGARGR